MSAREDFQGLLRKQKVVKGDVIFALQGDGIFRAPHAAELFIAGYAPLVAIVGNATDRTYGSFPSSMVRDELIRLGVPKNKILFEETAPHTRGEAERAMDMAKEHAWRSILIVTSPHHQYRAYLTFLKAMRDAKLSVKLVNAPADLSMSEELPWGRRADLLPNEFDKIAEYQQKGHVASYEEGVAYLRSL